MHQTQLMQKESTGLCALLQDDKKEGPRTILTACPARAFARSEAPARTELKRLYKLYSHLPTGLLPADDTKYGMTAVSKMVKDHIESVGNDLVKGQIGRSDGGDEFINQLIALHTKYHTLVEECFQDHTLFQKALKEVRSPGEDAPSSTALLRFDVLSGARGVHELGVERQGRRGQEEGVGQQHA